MLTSLVLAALAVTPPPMDVPPTPPRFVRVAPPRGPRLTVGVRLLIEFGAGVGLAALTGVAVGAAGSVLSLVTLRPENVGGAIAGLIGLGMGAVAGPLLAARELGVDSPWWTTLVGALVGGSLGVVGALAASGSSDFVAAALAGTIGASLGAATGQEVAYGDALLLAPDVQRGGVVLRGRF